MKKIVLHITGRLSPLLRPVLSDFFAFGLKLQYSLIRNRIFALGVREFSACLVQSHACYVENPTAFDAALRGHFGAGA